MSGSRLAFVSFSAIVTVLAMKCASRPPALPPSLRDGAHGVEAAEDAHQIVKRSAFFDFDAGPLAGPRNQTAELPLFDDVVIKAVGVRTERAGEGFVWIGEVRDQPRSLVILSVQGNVLSGTVRTAAGNVYDIRTTATGRRLVQELDASEFPKDDVNKGASSADLSSVVRSGQPCGGTDPGYVIDVLIAYTDAVLNDYKSQDGAESHIYGAVAAANQAFDNTRMSQRLNIAGIHHVTPYTETNNSCTEVTGLHDGHVDDLLQLRDDLGADAVVLLVQGPLGSNSTFDAWGKRTGCSGSTKGVKGEAYGILNPNDLGWEPHAFAVVDARYATNDLTFAHELGHLLGTRHDYANDPTIDSPFPDNHGFVGTTCNHQSVMAVDSTHTRIAYWSNTAHLPCAPFGTSARENNARAIGESSPVVANFRCSSPNRPDVWMRDTWKDTGKEPDAATAKESMWTSPYIWVRRLRDVNLIAQHQHQRPYLSSPVFVYVKVHNGNGGTASGQMELYFADSGTGLAFPSTFTLIGRQQRSIAASRTEVFEFPWTTPSATPSRAGNFAFVARWVSTNDPISNNGPNVADMTRASNNVVWRNLEIIKNPFEPPHAVVVVRNVRAFDDRFPAGPTTIRIAPPADEVNGSFFFHGRAVVTLGNEIAAAWTSAGAPGSGFEKLPDGRLLITPPEGAVLRNITIADTDVIRIDFQRTPSTPARTFRVEVTQEIGDSTVGGVTYELPPP